MRFALLLNTLLLLAAPALAQQADTTQVVPPDSAAVDSVAVDTAAVDTSDSVIDSINREVRDVGGLIVEGEWDQAMNRLYDGIVNNFLEFLPHLASAFFVFLLFYLIYRLFLTVLSQGLNRARNVNTGLKELLMKTYRVVAKTLILVMVLAQFGVNIATLLAGLSIAGLAVSLAARDSLENFISGVAILLDKPFVIGDMVQVEDQYGEVEEITLRSTRMRTVRNEIVVLPNIHMVNNKLINHSKRGMLRIDVPFGIAYKEDPREARKVVLKLTDGDDRLHPSFAPDVVTTQLNDSSVDMLLRLYVRDPKLLYPLLFEYTEKVRLALGKANIEIPFPHLQLFIDGAEAFKDAAFMQTPDGKRPQRQGTEADEDEEDQA